MTIFVAELMMMRLMTAAGWAAALVWVPWLCPTFATAARHHGTLHNGTVWCTYPRHTLAEQGTTQQQRHTTQSAPNQRPVQTHPCHLLFFQNCRLRLTSIKCGEAEAGKWWKKVKTGAMQRPMVSLLPLLVKFTMTCWSIRKQPS